MTVVPIGNFGASRNLRTNTHSASRNSFVSRFVLLSFFRFGTERPNGTLAPSSHLFGFVDINIRVDAFMTNGSSLSLLV